MTIEYSKIINTCWKYNEFQYESPFWKPEIYIEEGNHISVGGHIYTKFGRLFFQYGSCKLEIPEEIREKLNVLVDSKRKITFLYAPTITFDQLKQYSTEDFNLQEKLAKMVMLSIIASINEKPKYYEFFTKRAEKFRNDLISKYPDILENSDSFELPKKGILINWNRLI